MYHASSLRLLVISHTAVKKLLFLVAIQYTVKPENLTSHKVQRFNE